MSILRTVVASVVFGTMWNLEHVVPLLLAPYNSMPASTDITNNISWWFSMFGIPTAFCLMDENLNGPLVSSTIETKKEGTIRYFAIGGGDTRKGDETQEEMEETDST